jgi:hypothetical protein
MDRRTFLKNAAATGGALAAAGLLGSQSSTPKVSARETLAEGGSNPPWFPSLMAFEHYDSGRTKLFEQAHFTGSFTRANAVDVRVSPADYPTSYNVVYLSRDSLFVFGGAYGDRGGSGTFVARVDPQTLQPVWFNQLINTVETDECPECFAGWLAVSDLWLPSGEA